MWKKEVARIMWVCVTEIENVPKVDMHFASRLCIKRFNYYWLGEWHACIISNLIHDTFVYVFKY